MKVKLQKPRRSNSTKQCTQVTVQTMKRWERTIWMSTALTRKARAGLRKTAKKKSRSHQNWFPQAKNVSQLHSHLKLMSRNLRKIAVTSVRVSWSLIPMKTQKNQMRTLTVSSLRTTWTPTGSQRKNEMSH